MSQSGGSKDWLIEVEKVIRDEFGFAIWARIKYFKINEKGEKNIHHDAVFMPDDKKWVYVLHRPDNKFIPDKRYHRMALRACSIFFESRGK